MSTYEESAVEQF